MSTETETFDVVRPVTAALLLRAHLAGDEALVLKLLCDVHPVELIAGLLSIATTTGCRAFGDLDQLDAELREGLAAWCAE